MLRAKCGRLRSSHIYGRGSDDGPILLAADGLVFNVARGRNFYGPGGEYEVMAGADATRYLARNSVESGDGSGGASPLNLAQRGALATWVFSLKSRYDIVGKLASEEEEASMRKREEYMDRLEAISADFEREQQAAEAPPPPPPRQRNPYLEEPRLREWLDEQEEIRATEEARERLQKMWNSPDVDVDELKLGARYVTLRYGEVLIRRKAAIAGERPISRHPRRTSQYHNAPHRTPCPHRRAVDRRHPKRCATRERRYRKPPFDWTKAWTGRRQIPAK